MSDSTTTVVMPVINGARHIAEALQSVLPQLESRDRLVVVNDRSIDATAEIVEEFVRRDPRVELVPCEGAGCAAGRNTGLRRGSSEFVAFLDHDDVWPEDSLRLLRSALIDRPELDAVYGRMKLQFDSGPDDRYAPLDNMYVHRIGVWGCLFRRDTLRRVTGFDESMNAGEDTDYWLRLEEAGFASGPVDAVTIIYRRHPGNMTASKAVRIDGSMSILRRRIARNRDKADR
jgi:glycosyltransferase involved in cell wall biosynthesis